jgi:hypothetical protein
MSSVPPTPQYLPNSAVRSSPAAMAHTNLILKVHFMTHPIATSHPTGPSRPPRGSGFRSVGQDEAACEPIGTRTEHLSATGT